MEKQKFEDRLSVANEFTEYSAAAIAPLQQLVSQILLQETQNFNQKIQPGCVTAYCSKPSRNKDNDLTMFSGSGSYLYLYCKIAQFNQFKGDEQQANQYRQFAQKQLIALHEQHQKLQARKKSSSEEISFYMSEVGFYSIGAQLAAQQNLLELSNQSLQFILNTKQNLLKSLASDYNSIQQEVLYGVAGHLYAILLLYKNTKLYTGGAKDIQQYEQHILDLVTVLWQQGLRSYGYKDKQIEQLSLSNQTQLPQNFRLVYTFHGTEYLGGAHGLFGNLYMLLQAYEQCPELIYKSLGKIFLQTIRISIDYAISLQLPSGNFPSSAKRIKQDRLCQFCHGAPGAVQPLLLAHKIFSAADSIAILGQYNGNYLQAALLAAECVWQRGILRKGFGLCHGISGNAYTFLALFKTLQDEKWLYRALSFASLKNNPQVLQIIAENNYADRYVQGVPDYPYSLMQGSAGDICFIIDCLAPQNAAFPGYDL